MFPMEIGKRFSVVPDKKLLEVRSWFEEHFISSNRRDYLRRSPFIVFCGPTGCGKTTTLEWIAQDLRLSIKEYSETTDTSLIQTELRDAPFEKEQSNNTMLRIDRRKSFIFESFVANNVRYETLYANQPKDEDDAAAEFDDDDDFVIPPLLSQNKPKPPPSGVIIHIETPLTFARTSLVLIQCLRRLRRMIKEISLQTPRRVAIVFEAIDGNDPIMSLSSSVRQGLDIQVLRFNPVTRANMKKFIELQLKYRNYLVPGREILDQLIDDCDGDASACKQTLCLLCDQKHTSNFYGTVGIYKKQKMDYGPSKLNLNSNLMRDVSKGSSFFHILGKIFYQKRLYPDITSKRLRPRNIDRPYEAENTTEHLANQVDSETKKLNAWLHQNYTKFCEKDIEKASLFLENLSIVDTMSLDSTQSTQYYENHKLIDLMQKHVAIESTVFSLYKDESCSQKKSSDKKVRNKHGIEMTLRSSVETSQPSRQADNHYMGFVKPTSLIVEKISDSHQALLGKLSQRMTQISGRPYEPCDLLLDYAPYTKILIEKSTNASWARPLQTIVEEIQKFNDPTVADYEQKQETLLELLNHDGSQDLSERYALRD